MASDHGLDHQALESDGQGRLHLNVARDTVAKRLGTIAVLLLIFLFGWIVLRCAWISEDAYIMFRSIDNALHGDGLTWNLGERVQVYTCPLWLFVLMPAHALTGEYFYTAVAVSLLVSLGVAALIAWRIAPTRWAAAVAISALILSKGFMDYSSSGLENPLSHLMMAAFLALYLRVMQAPTARGLGWLTCVASLGMLNRLDTALLYAPALLSVLWIVRSRAALVAMGCGILPLIAWECFSLIYYGFPFPNTAYAKLHLRMKLPAQLMQGVHYYVNGWRADPMTLLVLAAAVTAPLIPRYRRYWPLAAGIGLYLLYVVRIGGDYMSLRFFTVPLTVAVVMLCRIPVLARRGPALATIAVLLAISWASPRCPLRSGNHFGTTDMKIEVDQYGIADERGYWYGHLGYLRCCRAAENGVEPAPDSFERERNSLRDNVSREVKLNGNVGIAVFRDNPRVHVVDFCALGDSLLARIPAQAGHHRVGHYVRHVPKGYVDSVKTGQNAFADKNLGTYYEKIQLIVRGPLWTRERWETIWQLHTGQLNHLIDLEHYRHTGNSPVAAN